MMDGDGERKKKKEKKVWNNFHLQKKKNLKSFFFFYNQNKKKRKEMETIDKTQTHIVIPDGVEMISDCAFKGCRSLISIVIPIIPSKSEGKKIGSRIQKSQVPKN
jgi:hypothetical protein